MVHCEFICISFSFVHAPVCANCNYSCKLYIFQKKQNKKKETTRTPVWVKIPKLCQNTPLSIFSLGKGGNPYIKTKYKYAFCPAPAHERFRFGQCVDNARQNCPEISIFFREFRTFPVTEGYKIEHSISSSQPRQESSPTR